MLSVMANEKELRTFTIMLREREREKTLLYINAHTKAGSCRYTAARDMTMYLLANWHQLAEAFKIRLTGCTSLIVEVQHL